MPRPPVIPKKEVAIAVLSHIACNPGQLTGRVEYELSDYLRQYQVRETMHWLLENDYVERRKADGSSGKQWHAKVTVREFLEERDR